MMNPLWTQFAAAAGLTLSEERGALLGRYIDLLLEANAVMNLTRIEDRSGAEVLHVADALSLLPHLPRDGHRLVDVGSGGGVPGLPIAIARPDVSVTLVESTKKKAEFLSRAAGALGLGNVKVYADRAETLGRDFGRDAFDVATARAVGALNVLVEWCLPLVRKGGKFLAMKGARLNEELPASERAIRAMNGAHATVHPVELPGTEHHVILEITKIGKTDPKYPRSPADVKRRPL